MLLFSILSIIYYVQSPQAIISLFVIINLSLFFIKVLKKSLFISSVMPLCKAKNYILKFKDDLTKPCNRLHHTSSMHFPNLGTINYGLSFHMQELSRHAVPWLNLVICNRILAISHFCTFLFATLICYRHMTDCYQQVHQKQ